jgi:AcrR family transcriptional regulator
VVTFERRQQILDEASALFAEGGYDGTSIRCIARACGITEAAIYRHFTSKAHLYEEVIRAKAAQHDIPGLLARADAGSSLEDVLGMVANTVLDMAERDPQLMRLMTSNTLDGGPVGPILFREIRLPFIEYVAGQLRRRLETGTIRPVDPLITARCFVGMVMDCALNTGVWEKLNDQRFQAGDVVCNNVPIFARGLEPADPLAASAQPGA